MNIIGEKVILRAVEQEDLSVLRNLMNDSDIENKVVGWSFPLSSQEHNSWFGSLRNDNRTLRCVIVINEKATIGTCVLSNIDWKNGNARAHIKIIKSCQGKGYGTDTIRTLVSYAFKELGLKCVWATALEENIASITMFEKCHFKKEGLLRRRVYKGGRYQNEVILSVLADDYLSNSDG